MEREASVLVSERLTNTGFVTSRLSARAPNSRFGHDMNSVEVITCYLSVSGGGRKQEAQQTNDSLSFRDAHGSGPRRRIRIGVAHIPSFALANTTAIFHFVPPNFDSFQRRLLLPADTDTYRQTTIFDAMGRWTQYDEVRRLSGFRPRAGPI